MAVGLSHLIEAPLETVADFGTKYGEPLSIMMAVCGGVAVVGQGANNPSNNIAMSICVFMVVPTRRHIVP